MPAVKAMRIRLSLVKREDGFTLNEILISIALIAIGVIGFSVNTVGVIQGNYISGNVTIATSLAQDKLEQLKVQTSFTNVTDSPDLNNPITETGASGGRFTRTWTIKSRPDLTPNDTILKEIDVTVSWRDYISRSVTLSTFVYPG